MAKPKLDLKAFLLKRGEVLVMGLAGFFLLVMLVWGVSVMGSAKDPGQVTTELNSKAKQVQTSIASTTVGDAEKVALEQPAWLEKPNQFKTPKVPEFSLTGTLFDPTAQPSTKRENPMVLPLGEYQVDLTRGAMNGYDIIFDANGDALIAVLTTKSEGPKDDAKLKHAAEVLKRAGKRGAQNLQNLRNRTNPGAAPAPGFPGAPPAPGGPPPGIGAPPGVGAPPPGAGGPPPMGGMGMAAGPHGLAGGGFQANEQRNEKAIKYIPLADIDKAVKDGNLPALTVIPLRLVTVHAVVPYKKQLDELKRALRLPAPAPILNARGEVTNKAEIEKAEAEARQWGPWYDGFEVQRKVSKVMPDGKLRVLEDWPAKPADPKDTGGNYRFEELYIDKIDTRKIADHFDEGYLPYFLKPEMMLAMPLPALAKDLNVKYPDIKLREVLENIDKLRKANQKELTQSELAKQLLGTKPKRDLYSPKTSDAVDGLGYDPKKYGTTGGPGGMGMGMGMPPGGPPPMPGAPPMPGGPRPPEGFGSASAVPVDIDNFLLRFVDCDVQPGYTYEYRIRLRMHNPNYGQDKLVANPEFAKESNKTLYSPWTYLATPITVPAESFLYAHDVKAYRDHINATYPPQGGDSTAESRAVNRLLQVKDEQAVVEVVTWMEQVQVGGTKREPVGAWVVAEMPVGRGEFVGRKQYVKLPLWSSENQQYVLREVADKVVKGKFQPKGWIVDFSTRSVLADFEGGKVRTRTKVRFDDGGRVTGGDRTIEEDAATELLIVRPDGKPVVRSSQADDLDPNRKAIAAEWTRWVKEVEVRKAAGGASGEPNPFDPMPKKP